MDKQILDANNHLILIHSLSTFIEINEIFIVCSTSALRFDNIIFKLFFYKILNCAPSFCVRNYIVIAKWE